MRERCTLAEEGFEACWFPGTSCPETAVIAVGGASCDERTSVAMSGFIREHGYSVLVLGFYMWKGLPKDLVSTPVDYAERAVHWLREKKGIRRIAMTGASTGAGYTLLAASLIPEISCVIPVVPYDYVSEGTKQTRRGYVELHKSQYTWHGEEVPYTLIRILDEKGMLWWLNSARKAPGYGLARFMRYGYDLTRDSLNPQARIRVENMRADVLFLAVKDDDCWPSDEAVPRMVKVLKEAGYPYRVEAHIYERGSHALTDGLSSMGGFAKWALRHMIPAEKKYPRECEEARQDSFQRILAFLEKWQEGDAAGG